MADVERAVALLDQLTGESSSAAPDERWDGHDFRADALRESAAARTPPPAWWDATRGRAVLDRADLRGKGLRSVNLSGVSLERADFTKADLAGGSLRGADLGGAAFDGALLEEADLTAASLRFATLRETVLEGAVLREADLWGANLGEADADKADFRDAQLEEADFRRADAREADFRGAKLGQTDFRGADLRRADFRGAAPRAAKFDAADLRHANLERLDLTNASLAGVWLSDARLDRTRFHRDQLGGAIGEEAGGEYELARRGYLALEQNFAAVGDPQAASWAYRRRRRMEKRSAWRGAVEAAGGKRWWTAAVRAGEYLGLQVVEWVCDYGESVGRVLATQAAVTVLYTAFYALVGGVERDDPAEAAGRRVTRSAVDIGSYGLTALLAPGTTPDGLHPSTPAVQLVTLSQSYLGIFLTGLLGFVAGNKIRR